MYGYLVGAEDRWEYLVAGDPLRQIGEAEPEAKQGEVILSPEAWGLTSTDFVAAKTPKVPAALVDRKQGQIRDDGQRTEGGNQRGHLRSLILSRAGLKLPFTEFLAAGSRSISSSFKRGA